MKRRSYFRQCAFKARFDSEIKAKENRDRHGVMADLYTFYHCPYCDGWHVGHKKRGKRRESIRAQQARSQRKQDAAFMDKLKGGPQ